MVMEPNSPENLKLYLKIFIRDMIPFKFGKKYYYDDFINIYFISRGMVYLISENGILELQSGQKYDDQSKYKNMGDLNKVFKKYISKFISNIVAIGANKSELDFSSEESHHNVYFVSNCRVYCINNSGVISYKPMCDIPEIMVYAEAYCKKKYPNYIGTLEIKYGVDLYDLQELFTEINSKINFFGPYNSNFWKRFFYHKENDNVYSLDVATSEWFIHTDKFTNRNMVNNSLTEITKNNLPDKNKMIKFNYVYGHYRQHYLYCSDGIPVIYGRFDNKQSWYILPRKYHEEIINNLGEYFPKKIIDKLNNQSKNKKLVIPETINSGMESIRGKIKSPRKQSSKIFNIDSGNTGPAKSKNRSKNHDSKVLEKESIVEV